MFDLIACIRIKIPIELFYALDPGTRSLIISLPRTLIVFSGKARSPASFVAEPGAQSNKSQSILVPSFCCFWSIAVPFNFGAQ